MQSDAELVNACLGGNKEAFAMLVKRYERPVRAVALGILPDYHIAQDIAQEAFVRAYQKLHTLRNKSALGPWLLKITGRCALETVRQRPKEAAFDYAEASPAQSRNGQLDKKSQQLLWAVMRLPKSEKQVVMLRYFGRNDVKTVADITGRSLGTVTKQLSRAHKRLEGMLKGVEE